MQKDKLSVEQKQKTWGAKAGQAKWLKKSKYNNTTYHMQRRVWSISEQTGAGPGEQDELNTDVTDD